MIKNQRPEEENIIKAKRNLFSFKKLRKETTNTTIKGIRIIFRLEQENEEIKMEYLEILEIFLRTKKKKIIINLQK